MKKFLIVIICIALIAGIIFCVNSCEKDDKITPESNPEGIIETTPVDDPNTQEDESSDKTEVQKPDADNSPVYVGTGIYHGKVDSSFIEVTIDNDTHPVLNSCRLSPELAKKFSSLNLEPESIISFEYQIIDEQYVIRKIN